VKKVATLGPEGTFSDRATKQFLGDDSAEFTYTKTIKGVFEQLADGTSDFGIVPVENMSEGYVQPTLDALLDADISIISELCLSVQFAFVAGVDSIDQLKTIFVQPVALGQCSEFINSLEDVTVIRTNSNIESLRLQEGEQGAGAIIPHHIFHQYPASLKIESVSDFAHNETRFLLLKAGSDSSECTPSNLCKSTLFIRDDQDHSGVLNYITGAFFEHDINITSIVSRPTKQMMGKYHFFIDIEGSLADNAVISAIDTIQKLYPVKLLGSYQRAL